MGYFKHGFPSYNDYRSFLEEHSKEEIIEKFKEVNKL